MAKGKRKGRPKQVHNPSQSKSVRQIEDPLSSERQTVAWRISEFDYGGPWGDVALKEHEIEDLVRKWAREFETQTWGELLKASGGKRKRNNHHPIVATDLSKLAQKRLEEIRKDDMVHKVFSFRIKSIARLYGIREGKVFNALWFDPWHNNPKKAVCPSKKRNT